MTRQDCIVFIVDDDRRICESLEDLLASRGLASVAFNSIAEYARYSRPDLPACLILDVQLPDVSGLEFQGQADDEHPPSLSSSLGTATFDRRSAQSSAAR